MRQKEETTGMNWVHFPLFAGWLILQAKHPIYEGDSVTLKCLGKKEKSIIQRDYYKDEEKIFGGSNLQQIIINSVFMDPGEYKCTASGKLIIPWTETSNSLRIQFQGNGYVSVGYKFGQQN